MSLNKTKSYYEGTTCLGAGGRKAIFVLHLAQHHLRIWGMGGVAPQIHNLDTRWRVVLSVAPQTVQLWVNGVRQRLDGSVRRWAPD
jgi:hypothetical protein